MAVHVLGHFWGSSYINERGSPAIQGGGKAQGKFFHCFRFDVCGEARAISFLTNHHWIGKHPGEKAN
jgi:hypothetical protein